MRIEPTCTTPVDATCVPPSRRLKERTWENEGSSSVASASKPKRSSPARSATTDGYHSTRSPVSLSKLTTG